MWAIQTEDLTRRYRDGTGVHALALAVPRGAVYGFLGANGAGKTTTIRLLLGLLRRDAGRIELLGTPLDATHRAVLAQVGALVESPALYPHLDGEANLEVTRRLLGLPHARIDAVLDRVGLRHARHKRVREYSLGMRQRLGIALALLASPQLLILDEPGNGLDPAGIIELRQLLCSLAEDDGVTVFVSSHQLSEVDLIATHLGVLDAGHLRFQGTRAAFREQARPRLVLQCDAPERAASLLHDLADEVHVHGDDELHLRPRASASAINARLVSHGIGVSHLALEPITLESLFLAMTTPARTEEAA